jgi:hypothetical protein
MEELIKQLLSLGSAAAPFAVYLLLQNKRLQDRVDELQKEQLNTIKEGNVALNTFTTALKELTASIRPRA